MIVVDASALCAIYLEEPEASAFTDILRGVPDPVISPINLWEARVTIGRRYPDPSSAESLEALLRVFTLSVAPVGEKEAGLAWDAWRRFGKGRHAAALNLGDCFAYAAAKSLSLPLLYKGNDFAQTDIEAA